MPEDDVDQLPVPQSLYLFVATGVVFLLQAFPPVGAFLMVLAAPVWSVVLVNAGFVEIVVEVLLGRVPPAWLALPALWFGGYALWRVPQRRALAALQREVAAANARVRVPFDPAAQALVVEESTTGGGWASPQRGWPSGTTSARRTSGSGAPHRDSTHGAWRRPPSRSGCARRA